MTGNEAWNALLSLGCEGELTAGSYAVSHQPEK